jgi:hypothetical protein
MSSDSLVIRSGFKGARNIQPNAATARNDGAAASP